MYKAFVHISSNQYFGEERWKLLLLFPFSDFKNCGQGSGMMHLGLYNLVWGRTEPIFWFGIPNSLSYVLSIALCFLFPPPHKHRHSYPCRHTHTHRHWFKWNLGCLTCFKTNLKAIYIILSWVRKKLLLEKSVITEVYKRLFHSQDRTNHAVLSTAQEETPNLRTCTQLRLSGKAMEIRKSWSPFKGSTSN